MPYLKQATPGEYWISLGNIIGDIVRDSTGNKLGKIEEILLNPLTGKVGYAVLSLMGHLALGDKLFAVPWQMLRPDIGNRCFVLNIDIDRLGKAPGFDRDKWPDMADPDWAREIVRFYQLKNTEDDHALASA